MGLAGPVRTERTACSGVHSYRGLGDATDVKLGKAWCRPAGEATNDKVSRRAIGLIWQV